MLLHFLWGRERRSFPLNFNQRRRALRELIGELDLWPLEFGIYRRERENESKGHWSWLHIHQEGQECVFFKDKIKNTREGTSLELLTERALYQFPRTTVKNYHQIDGLKPQVFIPSQFLRPDV